MAATCTEVGNTSLDDWEQLTWSFGWTSRPRVRVASVAMTSLVFMLSGARAGLKDVDGEVGVMGARGDVVRGGDDRVGHILIQHAEAPRSRGPPPS
ncbi:hypothetical protein GCM10025876_11400 [Demequina litorisediminis]|uniref:Uncharacterized protein n=1 Tax=Demequina litorisediminis TaxID=1849022 RepID=A0ABQ6ICD8_9MICO|nr:hypothetical protein GCM10025876_11400 [Demequina litorisediminis]